MKKDTNKTPKTNKNFYKEVVEILPTIIKSRKKCMMIFHDIAINDPKAFIQSFKRIKQTEEELKKSSIDTSYETDKKVSEPVKFFVEELQKQHNLVIALKDAKGIVDLATNRNTCKAVKVFRSVIDIKHKDASPFIKNVAKKFSNVKQQ